MTLMVLVALPSGAEVNLSVKDGSATTFSFSSWVYGHPALMKLFVNCANQMRSAAAQRERGLEIILPI